MKTLVVISDSHGNRAGVEKLDYLFKENDYALFLGDGFADVHPFFSYYRNKTRVCRGNCDFFSPLPEEGVLEIEDVRIFYCHGHRYGVKSGLESLAARAKELACEVALYGHTHTPLISEVGGVTLVNPGSLRFDVGAGGSYAYLVVNGKKVTAVLVGENPH